MLNFGEDDLVAIFGNDEIIGSENGFPKKNIILQ